MIRLFTFTTLIILLVSGCGQSDKKEETTSETKEAKTIKKETSKEDTSVEKTVVARINGKPIYKQDLNGRSVQYAIVREVLYLEGLRQGLDKDKKIKKSMEDHNKRVIINAVKTQLIKNFKKEIGRLSDEDIENFYNENLHKYTRPHLMKVTVKDKNIALDIHARALEGEDLEKIASDHSSSGTDITVTDLGFTDKYNNLFDE